VDSRAWVGTNASIPEWDFSIYPNPAQEAVHVLLPADDRPRDIVLFDLCGKRVFSRSGFAKNLLDIDVGTLAQGTFCLRVSDATTTRFKTLVIN
jgi:Secretion system C-terminal sorting domain